MGVLLGDQSRARAAAHRPAPAAIRSAAEKPRGSRAEWWVRGALTCALACSLAYLPGRVRSSA
eukprot:122857-Chlamydomonas_euryale.AAC.5